MSAPAGTGCVYCGLPRARARDAVGRVRLLSACAGHVEHLRADPAYDLAGYLAELAYPALDLGRAPSVERREGSVSAPLRPLAVAPERG